MPLLSGAVGDEREAEQHQRVPFPPAQPPAGRESGHDDDQGFGQEREGEADGEDEPGAPPPVQPVVAEGRGGVEQDADGRERDERSARLVHLDGPGERRQLRDRDDRPGADEAEQRAGEEPRAPHDRGGSRRAQVERGDRREGAGEQQPDGRRDHEARVLAADEHTRRRERVQGEEARAGDEGEPDQEQAGVAPAQRGLTDRVAEPGADDAGGEHDPEMRRVVLPAQVEARGSEQDAERDERKRTDRGPDRHQASAEASVHAASMAHRRTVCESGSPS